MSAASLSTGPQKPPAVGSSSFSRPSEREGVKGMPHPVHSTEKPGLEFLFFSLV